MSGDSKELIAIPIETKVRELDGKLWLGLNSVVEGYNVVLGPAFEIKNSLDITKPDVFITKDPGDARIDFFKSLHAAGISVCGLDTEGGVFESVSNYAANKAEFLNHIDAFCAWGEKPADAMRKQYVDTEVVHVTGNPRFDLLQPQLRFIYKNRSESLNQKYGRYVLVNTNFGVANPYGNIVLDKFEEVRGDMTQARRNYAKRIFYAFLESVFHLQSELPETNVVIRPHPSEKNETYEKAFTGFEHIHVEDSGDVRDWIAGASVVIHHDSTTGIECALMRTPVVSYRPVQSEKYESRLPQIVSHEALSQQELVEYVGTCIESNQTYEMNDEQTCQLKQYFHNVDESAAALICDVIDSLDTDKPRNYEILRPGLGNSIKRRIKSTRYNNQAITIYDTVRRTLGNDDIPKQREYHRQKFPGLEKNEIVEIIEQMKPLLDIETVSTDAVPLTNDTYYLSRQ